MASIRKKFNELVVNTREFINNLCLAYETPTQSLLIKLSRDRILLDDERIELIEMVNIYNNKNNISSSVLVEVLGYEVLGKLYATYGDSNECNKFIDKYNSLLSKFSTLLEN